MAIVFQNVRYLSASKLSARGRRGKATCTGAVPFLHPWPRVLTKRRTRGNVWITLPRLSQLLLSWPFSQLLLRFGSCGQSVDPGGTTPDHNQLNYFTVGSRDRDCDSRMR